MDTIKQFLVGFGSVAGLVIAYFVMNTAANFITSITGLDPWISFALIVIGMMLIGFAYGWFYLYPKVKALTKKPVQETNEPEVKYEFKLKEE